MLKTASCRYLAIVAMLGLGLIALMFALDPKIILPSIIGMIIFLSVIYVFYRIVSKKSESEQRHIAVRNGRFAQVAVVVLLALFFIEAAKHNDVSVVHFIRLWFGI